MAQANSEKIILRALISLLAAILFSSLVMIYVFNQPSSDAKTAEIYLDGELIKSVALSDITEPVFIEAGGGNVVMADSSGALMHSADCPDKLCVKQGRIKNGQSIVCLPNRVSVKLIGRENTEIDGIAG